MKKPRLSIVLLGSGNLAYHLGKVFSSLPGYPLVQWYTRSKSQAKILGNKFHCKSTHLIEEIDRQASLYILCISDDQIDHVAASLAKYILPTATVVHTSGSKPSTILKPWFTHFGVIYPLQTFTKTKKISFSTVPFFVTASDKKTKDLIGYAVKMLSKNVQSIDDASRLRLHLAAVLVNNFPNFIYHLTSEFLAAQGLSFKELLPLIEETTAKIKTMSPALAQTGPAKRKDKAVIQQHLALLSDGKNNDIKEVYALFSRLILNYYS